MRMFRVILTLCCLFFITYTEAGTTLESIKKKGYIQCGVNRGLPGFSNPDKTGNWNGLDVDYCRAVSVALFGKPGRVKFTPLNPKERFTALQSGEIDILSRNTTWTLSRDTALGFNFVGVIYYDGQGFIIKKDLGVNSARELDGATICVETGTTTELNLADYFRAHNMKYQPVVFENGDEAIAAYDSGRCDVFTTDQSGLYAQRIKLKDPKQHKILPDIISKEPLGPLVRQGDEAWFDIAKWTLFALINAEELGVTSKNIIEQKKSNNPAIKRLLGTSGDMGKKLGLEPKWAANIIQHLGNYDEIFQRNLGPKTTLKIKRGLNALWNQGGIMYAPPFR
ncbi:amino acid ABC transporter substrate-binding protein [Magnetococcales bacterium HHB-1]